MHHYLIVANQTLGGAELTDAIAARIALGPSRFHVLVPATSHRDLYHKVLDALEGEAPDAELARVEAEQRLARSLARIRANGARADGEVGEADPLKAVAHVLETQHFDEIIVSTLPAHMSHWLRVDLPSRVAHAFGLPVEHVVSSEGPHIHV